MKRLLLVPLLLLFGACDDAPRAPACRLSEAPSPDQANAGCVIINDGRLLVLKHRFGGKVGIPGGAAREGESAQCAAHRETWEETGLDVRVGRKLGSLRYGFTLYQCHPDALPDTGKAVDLPWHALLEVTDAVWLRPQEIPRDQWRYEDQVDAFMELVERAGQRPVEDRWQIPATRKNAP